MLRPKRQELRNLALCSSLFLLLCRPCLSFSSLCRSFLPDTGAFSNEVQCNDRGIKWPLEFQYCLPENWGLQCGVSIYFDSHEEVMHFINLFLDCSLNVTISCNGNKRFLDSYFALKPYNLDIFLQTCLQTCYFIPTFNDSYFLPFKYTFPSLKSFAQTCDVRTKGNNYNESDLGVYCCRPCKLYRLITEHCDAVHKTQNGEDQSCFEENKNTQAGLTFLRAQSSLDNSEETPHWLFIPPAPNRGIEDTRTDASLFQQAWRLAMDPSQYLKPIGHKSHGADEAQLFNSSIIPGKMGRTNVAIGINQADLRTQHQAHIHYAALPIPFRRHLNENARIPSGLKTCTVVSGFMYGEQNVTYFGWLFPWDLALLPEGKKYQAEKNKTGDVTAPLWTLRNLVLDMCPQLLDTLVKDALGMPILDPPTLPHAPVGSRPFARAGDFQMAQVAVIIAPTTTLDPNTQRPSGHYVLMGSTATRFHAESLLCTQAAIDGIGSKKGWDPVTDCPVTAKEWPEPEGGR